MGNFGLELIKLGLVGLCGVVLYSSLLLVSLFLSLFFCFTLSPSSSEDQSENGAGVLGLGHDLDVCGLEVFCVFMVLG